MGVTVLPISACVLQHTARPHWKIVRFFVLFCFVYVPASYARTQRAVIDKVHNRRSLSRQFSATGIKSRLVQEWVQVSADMEGVLGVKTS